MLPKMIIYDYFINNIVFCCVFEILFLYLRPN